SCNNKVKLFNSNTPKVGEINDLEWRRRRIANWAVYGEFAGAAWYYSVNIENLFESKEMHMFTGRIGIGVLPGESGTEINIPAMLNFLFGYKNHFAFGLGADFKMNNDGSQIYPIGDIGYRHQNPKGGIMYRVSVNVHFPRKEVAGVEDYVFEPWAGCGFGWAW
ncbi:MAG: hypothetical protein ABIJ97_08995, partial [Bacteroidota bacterium]